MRFVIISFIVLLKTLTWKGFFFKNQDNESAKYCHFQYKMHTVRITWLGAFGQINSLLSLIPCTI